MKHARPALPLAIGVVLWAIAGGCKSECDSTKSPAAATQPGASCPVPPAADKKPGDNLEARLQAAGEQAANVAKERDAALAQAKESRSSVIYFQGQAEEERKAATEADEKIKSLRSTLAALRDRLFASGDSDWVVRVEAEAFETRKDVGVKENPRASGGKALLFDKTTSGVETVITVRPGAYVVTPVGMAPDGGDHDALELTVVAVEKETGAIDVRQRVFFDEKFDDFVAASGSPPIIVAQEGKLKIGLKVDEETGALLDRVEIRVHVPK